MIEQPIPWDRQPPGLVDLAPWLPVPQVLWFAPMWRDIVGGLAPTVTGTVARAVSRGGVGASFQSGGILDFGDRFNEGNFTNLLVFEVPSLASTALLQQDYDNGGSESAGSQFIDITSAGDMRLVRDSQAVICETTSAPLAAKRVHWAIVANGPAGSYICIDGRVRATAAQGGSWITNGRYVLGRRRPSDLSATADHIQYLHARWPFALTPQEAMRLTGGQYAELFAPQVEEVFEPIGGGATPITVTSSLSAAVQVARTATASIAAAVQAAQTASASASVAVQTERTETASASAAVQASHTSTTSVATAVQAARSATASVAAAVQDAKTASASIAAALQLARTATSSAAAAVQDSHTATASITAYVQAGNSAVASLSAAVQAARTASASIAGAIQTDRSASASLAAAIATARTASASLAAGIQAARSASASISAQVQAGTTVVAQINAAIQQAVTAQASIAAAVSIARTASASLATAVAVQQALTAMFQTAVQRGRTATASLAAYVSLGAAGHTVSPRLYLVDAENRNYLVDPEDRTYIVPPSSRSTPA